MMLCIGVSDLYKKANGILWFHHWSKSMDKKKKKKSTLPRSSHYSPILFNLSNWLLFLKECWATMSNIYFFKNLPWFCFKLRPCERIKNMEKTILHCDYCHLQPKEAKPHISHNFNFFSPFLMRSQILILNFLSTP